MQDDSTPTPEMLLMQRAARLARIANAAGFVHITPDLFIDIMRESAKYPADQQAAVAEAWDEYESDLQMMRDLGMDEFLRVKHGVDR